MRTFAKLYETRNAQILVARHPPSDDKGPRVALHFMPMYRFLVSFDMEWNDDQSQRHFDDMTEEKAVEIVRRILESVEQKN